MFNFCTKFTCLASVTTIISEVQENYCTASMLLSYIQKEITLPKFSLSFQRSINVAAFQSVAQEVTSGPSDSYICLAEEEHALCGHPAHSTVILTTLSWLYIRPDLVVQNCSQGGHRMMIKYLKFIKQTEMQQNFVHCNGCINVYVSECSHCFPTASLREVEKAADHINSLVQDHENMQRMLKLQNCLCGGKPRIVMPGRRLLKEGTLLKVSLLSGLIHY